MSQPKPLRIVFNRFYTLTDTPNTVQKHKSNSETQPRFLTDLLFSAMSLVATHTKTAADGLKLLAERLSTAHSFLPIVARNRFQSVLRILDHVQARDCARFSSDRMPAVPKQSKKQKFTEGLRNFSPRGQAEVRPNGLPKHLSFTLLLTPAPCLASPVQCSLQKLAKPRAARLSPFLPR